MLRPAVLLRAFAAPPRWLPLPLSRQFAPSLILTTSRRCLATESSTPSPPPNATTTAPGPTAEAPASSGPIASPNKKSPPVSQLRKEARTTKQPQPSQIKRPFHVSRTPSGNLAVYELAKRGGNKKLTTIKKIEGDRAALRAALAEGLKIKEKDVKLNTLTGHLRVEGHRKTEITAWLEQQGF